MGMTDKEKVVEKLQAIDVYFRESFNAMDGTLACELFREWSNAAEDAITMLKAQDPVLVRYTTSTIRCPKCNKQITSRGAIHNEIKYCWRCGQAVKWE